MTSLQSLINAKLTPYEQAITALMSRGKLRWGWKLEPEQKLSVLFADELRKLTIAGAYKGIWCHVANEGKRSQIVGAILKAMGLIPGSPDYWFIWQTGRGVIELKVRGNTQQPTQKHFQQWCEGNNIPYAVCYSVEQALEVLRQWQAIQ